MHLAVVHLTAVHLTVVHSTAVRLAPEYLDAVHLTQFKLTAFNLTATDTNLQARRTFTFLAMNESINELMNKQCLLIAIDLEDNVIYLCHFTLLSCIF